MAEFWFNTSTGQVEEGRVSDWAVVLGPYPTREAAARALDTAAARSAAWDRQDKEWAAGGPSADDDAERSDHPGGPSPRREDPGSGAE